MAKGKKKPKGKVLSVLGGIFIIWNTLAAAVFMMQEYFSGWFDTRAAAGLAILYFFVSLFVLAKLAEPEKDS